MKNNINVDVRKTMEELNYLIDKINEFWNEGNFLIQEREEIKKTQFGKTCLLYLLFFISFGLIPVSCWVYSEKDMPLLAILLGVIGVIGVALPIKPMLIGIGEAGKATKAILSLNRELTKFIKVEWNPRMTILKKNALNYATDKDLREQYAEYRTIDIEVQKMSLITQGNKAANATTKERLQPIGKIAKVVGVGTSVVGKVILGGTHFANKQWNRDH